MSTSSLLKAAVAVLLISQVPLFLQMPLTADAALYDLQARVVLNGGVLYRDIVEPNLPGVVWVHSGIRFVFGWADSTLRLVDLIIVGCSLVLTGRLAAGDESAGLDAEFARRRSALTFWIMLFGGLMFYLSMSEWCHCQRDTWMLLPSLAAVHFRVWRSSDSSVSFRTSIMALLEGTLWGVAFWLKPFVAFPALGVMLWDWRSWRTSRSFTIDCAVVVLGGMIAGVAGILWMVWKECWGPFLETLLEWNGDYFRAGRSRWTMDRFLAHAHRFFPWILLHVPALMCCAKLFPFMKVCGGSASQDGLKTQDRCDRLIAGMYVGWLAQAFLLQQMFDYIHVPALILAIALCCRFVPRLQFARGEKAMGFALAVFFVVSLPSSPVFRLERIRAWPQCVASLSGRAVSAETADVLRETPFPRWTELDGIVNYLNTVEAGPGHSPRVMAYHGNLIHLYRLLGSDPPTRFVYTDVLSRCFPTRRQQIAGAIEHSDARYVVADLVEDGWQDEVPDGRILPEELETVRGRLPFPWNQTPVFRQGSYVVFRRNEAVGDLSSAYQPLAELQSAPAM